MHTPHFIISLIIMVLPRSHVGYSSCFVHNRVKTYWCTKTSGVVTRVRLMVGIRVVRMCDVHHHAAMHARMMYIIIQNDTPMLFKLAEFLLIF